MNWTKSLAAAGAIVGWFGLALQLVLIIDNLGLALGLWRFVGFFTILANLGVAAIASAIIFGGPAWLAGQLARLMGLTSIATVGIVYSLLLRSLWSPQGWQKAADMVLHDVTPILFLILWAVMPHGALRWSDLKWALLPPALYLAYALARGALDGWYAYWFLDPSSQNFGHLVLGMLGVLAVFAFVAVLAIAADRSFFGRRS